MKSVLSIVSLMSIFFAANAHACISQWNVGKVVEPTSIMRSQGEMSIQDGDILVLNDSIYSIESVKATNDGEEVFKQVGKEIWEDSGRTFLLITSPGKIVLKKGDGSKIELTVTLKPRYRCG